MKMNKKGSIVGIVIALLILGAFIVVYIYQSQAYQKMISFGERPREIMETYSFAEQTRAYLKNAVKASVSQAIYEVGISGAYAKATCNDPISHIHCITYRDDFVIDSFVCDPTEFDEKETVTQCEIYLFDILRTNGLDSSEKINDFLPYESDLTFTADCGFANEYIIVCADFDEIDQKKHKTDKGVKCTVFNGEGGGVDAFVCYSEDMAGCERYGIPAVAGGTEFESSEYLLCDIYDTTSGVAISEAPFESFGCYKDLREGCIRYGVNSPGSHIVRAELYCDTASLDIMCTESPCGSVSGYSVWYDGTQDCVPDEKRITETIYSFFDAQFEKMLYSYKIADYTLYHTSDVNISVDLSNNKAVISPIVYTNRYISFDKATPVIKEEQVESALTFIGETNFTYTVSPYMEVTLPYAPVSEFSQIGQKAVSLVKSCSGDPMCVEDNAGDAYGYHWKARVDLGHMLFDLKSKTQKAIVRTPEGNLKEEYYPVKFAVKL